VLLAIGCGASAAQAGALDVFVGECPRGVDCVAQPNRVVSIPNAAVCLVGRTPAESASRLTLANGIARFDRLDPGSHWIIASKDGYMG
jgi:hypothetical protein